MTKRLIPALAGLALLLAACSGSADAGVASLANEPANESDEDAAATASDEAALLAFAQCMRENGIEGFEDPTVDDEGSLQLGGRGAFANGEIDRETMITARAACSQYLDDAALGFGRPDDSEIQDQLLAFAECMRDRGIEVDDPDFSGGPGDGTPEPGGGPLGDIDFSDPDVQEAVEACQGDFGRGFGPGRGGPPGGGSGGGST